LPHILGQALFPYRCIYCDRHYEPWSGSYPDAPAEQRLLKSHLCPTCVRLLEPIASPLCITCGRPFETDQAVDHVCGRCESARSTILASRSAMGYASAMRRLIHRYKYQGCVQLAKPLGAMLWKTFQRHWPTDQIDLVVPVPLHRRRQRWRGFNQSALMLRYWPGSRVANAGFRIVSDLLVRHRATRPQVGLDADARRINMANAFRLRNPSTIKDRHVLLVDDVLTTGATVDACARSLMQAGAATVRVLTLARAV
jgi:ComF family protein